MYLPPTSGVESFYGKSEPRRNLNSNLNNLVIGFCYPSCAFWRIGLNGHQLLLLGDFKELFVKIEVKKQSINACPQFCCVFYLLLTTFYLCFPFLRLLSQFIFYYCFCHRFLFSQFSLPSSLRSFLCPPQVPPFSSMFTAPLYHGLIPWDFSLLPLRLHQLLLIGCGHPFRTAHQPIGCLTTITTG